MSPVVIYLPITMNSCKPKGNLPANCSEQYEPSWWNSLLVKHAKGIQYKRLVWSETKLLKPVNVAVCNDLTLWSCLTCVWQAWLFHPVTDCSCQFKQSVAEEPWLCPFSLNPTHALKTTLNDDHKGVQKHKVLPICCMIFASALCVSCKETETVAVWAYLQIMIRACLCKLRVWWQSHAGLCPSKRIARLQQQVHPRKIVSENSKAVHVQAGCVIPGFASAAV